MRASIRALAGLLPPLAPPAARAATALARRAPPLPPSHALAHPEATLLGRLFAAEEAKRPGLSGFALLESGPEAFRARQALIALAERTLDVQYYIWEDDASGRLLLAALIEAADRGVRVRILLDDIHTRGRDPDLALIDAHPSIEVQLFNPFADRHLRVLDLLRDFARVNHRMHNKAMIADNAVAIVGGRNVGDHYFVADARANFRDLDLFAAGPVVRELSESFDDFWNSDWSVNISVLVRGRPAPERMAELSRRLDPPPALPFDADLDPGRLAGLVQDVPSRLLWGEATMVADRPDKPSTAHPGLIDRLQELLHGTATRELLIESAYFIPGRRGVRYLCALVARGVRVSVLTNSLASNDVAIAHSGYAKYRAPLLRCRVELHELRSDARFVRREWTWLRGRSTAVLHTKAIVVDRRVTVVGSLNLDPRSRHLNTEIAVVVDCPELAAATAAFIEAGMTPENAYRLGLDGPSGCLVWTASDGERPLRLTREPQTGFWRRLALVVLSWLPIEGQL